MTETLLLSSGGKITREQLRGIVTPPGTATHKPIPHSEVVQALVETLGFRHIAVVRDEYAVSNDGMKMFGVLDLEAGIIGVRFSIGIRNAHDKSMRLGLIVGFRVLVCDNMAFSGDFSPVLAKHSKNFNLIDSLSVGVDRMQRNFEPMRKQVETWRGAQITDMTARMVIYAAFIEGELDAPSRLAHAVHRNYFHPEIEEFTPRTVWSLANSFTSAFKELDPFPQFRVAPKLGPFLERMLR